MEPTRTDLPNLSTLRPVENLRKALRPEVASLTGGAVLCAVFACVSLVGLTINMHANWRYSRHGVATTGRVHSIRTKRNKHTIRYSFETEAGKRIVGQVTSRHSLCHRLKEGDTTAVEYIRHEPTTNRIPRTGWSDHVWDGSPAFFLVALTGLAAYLWKRRSRRLDALGRLLASGILTEAAIEEKTAHKRKRRRWFVITYRFRTPSGKEYDGKDRIDDLAFAETLEEDQTIPIAYLPDNPWVNVHFSPRWLDYYQDDEARRALEAP